jgi:magnesium-transporting ATPase (P-type)
MSALCCLVAVVLAFGTLFQGGAARAQWPVIATMQLGLVGFLNAKGSQAGPLPYEFSELLGAVLEPDNLSGDTWSALLITTLLFVFLVYALTRYRLSESAATANRILLTALLVALFTPLAGDVIGDTSEAAHVIVDTLELGSAAGFLLAALVSFYLATMGRAAATKRLPG